MIRQFFYILLLIDVMVRSAFTPFTLLFYTLDKEVFVEYLCVNTDQPELHCEGQCQLKKIGDFYAHEHHEQETKIVYFQSFWIVEDINVIALEHPFPFEAYSQYFYQEFLTSTSLRLDFKPPIV